MQAPGVVLVGIAGIAILYVLVPIIAGAYTRYRRKRTMHCPEAGVDAEVQIDPVIAALTAVPGPAELHVQDCSLWPEREGCQQSCLQRQ